MSSGTGWSVKNHELTIALLWLIGNVILISGFLAHHLSFFLGVKLFLSFRCSCTRAIAKETKNAVK